MGRVGVIAEVSINGKPLGVLWKPPFSLNIDGYVKEGTNTLEIKVTNLWPNRLIGDEQFPEDVNWRGKALNNWPEWLEGSSKRLSKRKAFASYQHWKKGSRLKMSGLLGPVIIRPFKIKILELD